MTTANPDNDPALLEPHGKAWLEAAKRGDVHAMQPLLAAEPRLLGYCGKGCSLGFIGHSALHWAAAKGLVPLAKWLVECNADVHLRNNAESTPLHAAAQNNQVGVAEIPSPNPNPNPNRTPDPEPKPNPNLNPNPNPNLNPNQVGVAEILLRAGASGQLRDADGNSAALFNTPREGVARISALRESP